MLTLYFICLCLVVLRGDDDDDDDVWFKVRNRESEVPVEEHRKSMTYVNASAGVITQNQFQPM